MATRYASFLVCTALVAGCAQTPPVPTKPPAPPPPPAAAPEPPPPAPPVTPETRREAQLLAEKTVVPLLEQGREDQARTELGNVLQKDPANKLGLSLMRQITDDPVGMFGRESFSYRVKANDSLSSIAAMFMKDKYLFYGLARYNNIAVPRQIAAGQDIRIPGKAQPAPVTRTPPPRAPDQGPPPAATPEAPPADAPTPAAPVPPPPPPAPAPPSPGEAAMQAGAAAERANQLDRAYTEYQTAAAANQPGAAAKVDAIRTKLVAARTRDARTARANQDLDGAIKAWDRVLALDPTNEAAKTERNQTIELKKKLDLQRGAKPN